MIHQVLRFLGYVHLYMRSLLDLLGCPFSGSLVPLLSSLVLGGVLGFAFRRPLLLLLPLVFVPPRVLVVLVPVPVVLGPPPVAVVAVVLVLAFSLAVSTLFCFPPFVPWPCSCMRRLTASSILSFSFCFKKASMSPPSENHML